MGGSPNTPAEQADVWRQTDEATRAMEQNTVNRLLGIYQKHPSPGLAASIRENGQKLNAMRRELGDG